MTVTVEAGIRLADLQAHLARFGQWIPVDPPHPERVTVERLLALNLSGPHRCGFGTVRDHVIGVRMAMVDGCEIHSGGQVVKNVAGFDLHKLAIGAQGSLGVVVEVTFKLMPLPEATAGWQASSVDWRTLSDRIESIWSAKVQPVVFDVHRLNPAPSVPSTVVLGFAGSREDVAWQSEWATTAGFTPALKDAYDEQFGELNGLGGEHRFSVLPSELVEHLANLGEGAFVARAANGSVRFRAAQAGREDSVAPAKVRPPALSELVLRVKRAFDPNGILPPLP